MSMHRIFHPVGQGVFFSERFRFGNSSFNVVYDCGSLSLKGKKHKAKVNSAFRKNEVIDILFISHFHADHINGIEHLIKGRHIKNVVIPLLDDENKALYKVANLIGEGYLETEIIDSPETYFGDRTRIIRVSPEGEGSGTQAIEDKPFNIDLDFPDEALSSESRKAGIPSGQPIISRHIPYWFFVPFNYEMTARIKPFVEALGRQGLTVSDLDTIEHIQKYKKKLVKAYEEVEGDLNKTSLIIYSGPNPGEAGRVEPVAHVAHAPILYPYSPVNHLAGCLYTGDADVNEPGLLDRLEYRLTGFQPHTGTLVLPHHGAIGNFDVRLLEFAPALQSAVVPFGLTNSYGHPSDTVIAALVGHRYPHRGPYFNWEEPRNMIVRVTEEAASLAVYQFEITV